MALYGYRLAGACSGFCLPDVWRHWVCSADAKEKTAESGPRHLAAGNILFACDFRVSYF